MIYKFVFDKMIYKYLSLRYKLTPTSTGDSGTETTGVIPKSLPVLSTKSVLHKAGRYSSVSSDVAWESEAPRSILASGTSFSEDLVMKLFLRPFFLFR